MFAANSFFFDTFFDQIEVTPYTAADELQTYE